MNEHSTGFLDHARVRFNQNTPAYLLFVWLFVSPLYVLLNFIFLLFHSLFACLTLFLYLQHTLLLSLSFSLFLYLPLFLHLVLLFGRLTNYLWPVSFFSRHLLVHVSSCL